MTGPYRRFPMGGIHRLRLDATVRELWHALAELQESNPEALTDEDVDLSAKVTKHSAVQMLIGAGKTRNEQR